MELVAIGPQTDQRLSRELAPQVPVRLGRSTQVEFQVTWDSKISRQHAELLWNGQRLTVRCLESGRNPLVYRGNTTREVVLEAGESFQIGDTVFRVDSSLPLTEISTAPQVLVEHAFSPEDLRRVAYGNSDQRLEVLARLPRVIADSLNEEDFYAALAGLLLQALPRARAAAVVAYPDGKQGESVELELMRCATRDGHPEKFRPSRRLIQRVLMEQSSRLHIFKDAPNASDLDFSSCGDSDWAFCTPVIADAGSGLCLYVAGRSPSGSILSQEHLQGDVRFTELLAEFVGAIRQVRRLQQQQLGLRQFFSPMVMETLIGQSSETILQPRECDITVLFCDVRGFSRKAEQAQHSLHELLGRVSNALGVMSHGIIQYDGIIADFQGDAALGFWGWPIDPPAGPVAACRAALDIHAEFRSAFDSPGHPLSDFRVGIGLAHGRAIAGKIGTSEQAKVGVFGPVVNLGSRLESLTKFFRASILMDEATAEFARKNLPPSEGRCRRLARVKPYGMETTLDVTELLPPAGKDLDISDAHIATYERALDHVIDGTWASAMDLLSELPVRDRAKDFLMIYLAQHNYEPPPHWDGSISMSGK